jgi:hypothetical protein
LVISIFFLNFTSNCFGFNDFFVCDLIGLV